MNKQNCDILIVGQGLAGSLLAFELIKRDFQVLVVDQGHQFSSSSIAAGIVNPITGRRFVKSWKIDQLLPVMESTYTELTKLFDQSFFKKRDIIRALFNRREVDDWSLRTTDPGYEPFIQEFKSLEDYEQMINPAYAYGGVLQGGHVNIPSLIDQIRNWLSDRGCLLEESFDYSALELGSDLLRYKHLQTKRIVFL